MKTALIPVFIVLGTLSVFSQGFKSGKINAGQWDTNVPLILKSDDGRDQIKVATKSKKQRRSSKNIKQLEINGTSYQLIESCGRINILDSKGNILLKTNRDRTEIFLGTNERYTRKRVRGNTGVFEYVDDAKRVVVSGQLKGGIIELKNHSRSTRDPLMALCLEELLQHAYDRYLNAIMTSSFLAQTD